MMMHTQVGFTLIPPSPPSLKLFLQIQITAGFAVFPTLSVSQYFYIFFPYSIAKMMARKQF